MWSPLSVLSGGSLGLGTSCSCVRQPKQQKLHTELVPAGWGHSGPGSFLLHLVCSWRLSTAACCGGGWHGNQPESWPGLCLSLCPCGFCPGVDICHGLVLGHGLTLEVGLELQQGLWVHSLPYSGQCLCWGVTVCQVLSRRPQAERPDLTLACGGSQSWTLVLLHVPKAMAGSHPSLLPTPWSVCGRPLVAVPPV